ncbi:MAG: DNA-directed DNA polymerase II small subunit [Candidatus Woesearchaeota archaeon]|jgi:DNA polymerase II small subunit
MIAAKELITFLLSKQIVVTSKNLSLLKKKDEESLGKLFEIIKMSSEDEIKKILSSMIEEPKNDEVSGAVSVIYSCAIKNTRTTFTDFVSYFNARYKYIEKILRNRQELQNVTSIRRVSQKDEKEQVAVIGMVKKINETKNNNIIVTVEDQTGEINLLISKNKREVFDSVKVLVLDEIIGAVGVSGKGIIFVNKILYPDIPVYNELKKSPVEEYAIFLSDFHVGSKQFLDQSFEKFLRWINNEIGDEKQRELVKKIKYIFIMGDIVDGVGIYPGQEKDLEIIDIYDQYTEAARLLSKIPKHMQLIICPGNHDAVRMAEPQMPFYEDIAKPIYDLPNALIVSNPSWVTIGAQEGFPGITVLLYHGYSFDYYIANVDDIRNNGGYDRADLVMKFLLQKRHLAPTHASCLYIPYAEHDPLIISKIPDIFATGHLHKTSVSTYRNVTLICGSCWQGKTAFQEKVGHNPEPGRVPLVNLQTREMKILRFGE